MKRVASLFGTLALASLGLSLRAEAPTFGHINVAGGILVGREYDQVYINTDLPAFGVVSDTTLTDHKWGFVDSAQVAGTLIIVSAPEFFSPNVRVTITVDSLARTASVVETDALTGEVLTRSGVQNLVNGGFVTTK